MNRSNADGHQKYLRFEERGRISYTSIEQSPSNQILRYLAGATRFLYRYMAHSDSVGINKSTGQLSVWRSGDADHSDN